MSTGISIGFYDCKPWAEPITRFSTLVLNYLFIFQNEFWQIIIYFSIFLKYIHIFDTNECTWTFFHSFLFTSIGCYVSWLCLHVLFLKYTLIFVCLHKMIRSNHIINDVITTNNCNSMALFELHQWHNFRFIIIIFFIHNI